MATKTAEKPEKAERKTKGKAEETPDQEWDRTQRERADASRERSTKEQERRLKFTPQEITLDDSKKAHEAEAEARRWDGLTQEERNKELDDPKSEHYEPLPPWQKRLGTGKVFDARQNASAFTHLICTDGTMPASGDRQEALEFMIDYMSSDEEE